MPGIETGTQGVYWAFEAAASLKRSREMSKISLVLVGGVIVVAAMLTPSFVVRAQGITRFEYVRVTSYPAQVPSYRGPGVQMGSGYRACVAGTDAWNCRQFPPTESSDTALRNAIATLGNEGWELVAAVVENPANGADLTYLFKRQAR
jgi:hypothetical protein